MDLFSGNAAKGAPLADRMRPRVLDEFIGQEHIVGKGRLLRRAIEADKLTSCIFFGPPGCGKSTLAEIIANTTKSNFRKVNAVTTGVKEVRGILSEAESELMMNGKSTYLLLDECHRWAKAQSDSILPAIEKGIIKFIGSTTENPLVAMTPAIVSRCRLFQFQPLTPQDVEKAIHAALADEERGFGRMQVEMTPEAVGQHRGRGQRRRPQCAERRGAGSAHDPSGQGWSHPHRPLHCRGIDPAPGCSLR